LLARTIDYEHAYLELEVVKAPNEVCLERGVAQVGNDPGQQVLVARAKVVVEPTKRTRDEHLPQI
jgi:hypothetical protein